MLELRDITKTFGSVVANDRVSISVPARTIHALVGENGAGKSTAMKIAYGFYNADAGEIVVDGKVEPIATPRDAIRLGIGMVHQHFMLVDTLTVTENIILGAEPAGGARAAARNIAELSKKFRLAIDPNARLEYLSVGQQQRV